MFFAVFIFVLLTTLSFVKAQQDLCKDAFAKNQNFAADPGDCTRYIYCEKNTTNHLVRIGYGQCNQATDYKFFNNGACTTNPASCAPQALCPPAGTPDIRVSFNPLIWQ